MEGSEHWGHWRKSEAGLMGALGAFPTAHSHQHPQVWHQREVVHADLLSLCPLCSGTAGEEQDIKCHKPSGMKAHKPSTCTVSIGKQVAGTSQERGCGQPLPCCAHREVIGALNDTNGRVEHSSLA